MNLYHFKRQHFKGNTLYPLNQLKAVFPESHAEEIKKYEGREIIFQAKIPRFHCLWNDVLHISPFPFEWIFQLILDAHKELGLDDSKYRERLVGKEYFIIPSEALDESRLLIFLNNRAAKVRYDFFELEDLFLPFNVGENLVQQMITPAHKQYLRESLSQGESPLIMKYMPHVLYRGTIDVRHVEVRKMKL